MNTQIKKSKFYGAGKHRSVVWWKELCDNLVKLGFLQQAYLKGGRFPMAIVRPTKSGLMWLNTIDLDGLLDGLGVSQLGPMKMMNTI